MTLPASLIGQAISWGFDDTEVGDSVYVFIDKHFEEVAARVRQATD